MEAYAELSTHIATQTECVRLASKLGFGGSAVLKWSLSTDPIDKIAMDILFRWNASMTSTEEAKQSVLENALSEIRQDLGNIFQKMCMKLTGKKK